MPRLSASEVRRIAALARLELTDEEIERLSAEMASILAHFEQIEELSEAVDGPLDRALADRLRADRVDSDSLLIPLAEMAPDWREGFFVVPRLPAVEPGDR